MGAVLKFGSTKQGTRSTQWDATDPKTSLVQQCLNWMVIFSEKKGVIEQGLWRHDSPRSFSLPLLLTLPPCLRMTSTAQMVRWRGEGERRIQMLQALLNHAHIFSKNTAIRTRHYHISYVLRFAAAAPASFRAIQISVQHPFGTSTVVCRPHWFYSLATLFRNFVTTGLGVVLLRTTNKHSSTATVFAAFAEYFILKSQ